MNRGASLLLIVKMLPETLKWRTCIRIARLVLRLSEVRVGVLDRQPTKGSTRGR
jgi:hypothetical protein